MFSRVLHFLTAVYFFIDLHMLVKLEKMVYLRINIKRILYFCAYLNQPKYFCLVDEGTAKLI